MNHFSDGLYNVMHWKCHFYHPKMYHKWIESSSPTMVVVDMDYQIKGPDNPTRQLLPIMSTKCCSGDGEERKDKGGGGGSRSKTKLCVCDKVVWERWCVCVWQSCVWKLCVKESVWQSCVWKMVCVKDGVWKMVCERWWLTKMCVWEMVYERWCV
jgi:hypothetical protein